MAAIAAALSGASTITFFYDQVFVKEPGTEGLTQWHQDQPYMAVDGQQLCSNWIPLDPITPETTLEFVRGSHLWGRWFAPFDSMLDGTRHSSAAFERCPDIEAAREDYDIVSWELEPGDCIFFQGLIVHQGRNNPTRDTRRRTLTHRWLGDDIRFILRDPPAEFPKHPTALRTGPALPRRPAVPGRLAGVRPARFPVIPSSDRDGAGLRRSGRWAAAQASWSWSTRCRG